MKAGSLVHSLRPETPPLADIGTRILSFSVAWHDIGKVRC